MIVLFYNYADPDGNPTRAFMGIFDDVENIPTEYKREEWDYSDNYRDDWDGNKVIEPQIKRYGGKRFYPPNESMEFEKMFNKLDWYYSFGFYSAHEVEINKIIKLH